MDREEAKIQARRRKQKRENHQRPLKHTSAEFKSHATTDTTSNTDLKVSCLNVFVEIASNTARH